MPQHIGFVDPNGTNGGYKVVIILIKIAYVTDFWGLINIIDLTKRMNAVP